MIIETVRAILLADAALVALIDDRVFPQSLPDAVTYPAIALIKVSGPGMYDLAGDVGLERARVQVDVFHDGGASALIAVKRLVRARLSGYQGSPPGHDACQVQSSFCINDFDHTAPATERAGPMVRRRILEFDILNRSL